MNAQFLSIVFFVFGRQKVNATERIADLSPDELLDLIGSLGSVANDVAPLIARLLENGLQTTHNNGNELKKNHEDSKYAVNSLEFGDFPDFLAGLEGIVGKPDRNLLAGLKGEHDNDFPIESRNYNVKTTPRLEFRFVFDKTEQPDFAETSEPPGGPRVTTATMA